MHLKRRSGSIEFRTRDRAYTGPDKEHRIRCYALPQNDTTAVDPITESKRCQIRMGRIENGHWSLLRLALLYDDPKDARDEYQGAPRMTSWIDSPSRDRQHWMSSWRRSERCSLRRLFRYPPLRNPP